MSEISNGIHFNIGISGLNNAGRTRNVVRRFIWLVIFLVGLAFTLFSTIVVVLDMLEYPVDTTVTRTMQNYVPRAYRILCPDKEMSLFLLFRSDFQQ